MKKKSLILGIALALCLVGCGQTEKEPEVLSSVSEGRVTISGALADCRSIKVNIPTECCDEYDAATECVMKMENASSYQVYQIDMYNKKDKETNPDGTITIEIELSDEILSAHGDEYKVYKLVGSKCEEINNITLNDNVMIFETDVDGDYVVVKFDSTGSTTPIYAVPENEGACGCC